MKSSTTKQSLENPMRKIRIEKVLLSCGATGKDLEKASKLLALLSEMKVQIIASQKRIPDFGVSPDLEVGARVTLRGEKALSLLKRLLSAEENKISSKHVSENHFSFGIKEYIEIPGIEYQRDIGIRGLNITVVFVRPGLRLKRKKIKTGRVPKRQFISPREIMNYMEEHFKVKFT